MRKLIAMTSLLASLFWGAGPVSAQGYNSFVIEVPYEISLPPKIKIAMFQCSFSDEDVEYRWRKKVDLVDGQASGIFKIGYDLNGSIQDLSNISVGFDYVREIQLMLLESDFSLEVDCTVYFSSSNDTDDKRYVRETDGIFSISADRWDNGRIWLEGQTDPSRFNVVLTHSDNVKPLFGPAATTVVPEGRGTSGLQVLDAILDPK